MRILVISQYYYPEQFRITDICEELVKRGHSVTVVTGLPNYPEGEVYPGYEHAFQEPVYKNGVLIRRCKIRPRHKGSINLALNYLSFVVHAIKLLKKLSPDFDLIYVYEVSPITMAIPAILYKKWHSIPVYFYCMDIWPECVRDAQNGHKTMGKRNPIYLIAKWISVYVYNNVDLIGIKCNEFKDYLIQTCGIEENKIALLYEHAEGLYLSVEETVPDNNCLDFMFLGNIGKAQNCETIIKATSKIETDKKFLVHFVGDGSELANLKELVNKTNLQSKVLFHGRYPIAETISFYNIADCCLLSLSDETASGLTPPGKLFSYMAAGKPIIGAIKGAAESIIINANCGWCVPPNDENGLAELMQLIIEHPELLVGKGANARQFFMKNFTLNQHVDNLISQLDIMIGEK